MPFLSAPRFAYRAIACRIGVALDLLAAIGARRLANTYHALDNEPYRDTRTDDEAERTKGVATAARRPAANSFQTRKPTTSGD